MTSAASRARTASSTALPSDAGTIALRMAVHFCPAFTLISRTTSRTKSSNSGAPACTSSPSIEELSESVSAVKRTERSAIAACRRRIAAVAAEPVKETTVLAVQVIEQIADAAADELHGACRQHTRIDDAPEDKRGEVRGGRCGFDDRRYACQERRGELLEHAPHRKIKCVDVHGGAFERLPRCAGPGSGHSWRAPQVRHRDTRGHLAARAHPCWRRQTAC